MTTIKHAGLLALAITGTTILPAHAQSGSGAPQPTQQRLTIKDGFSTPESVVYDEAADVYLVSNVNGKPAEADDNGYIARVSPDGKVVDPKWIDGAKPDVKLDAPKGMAISKGVLYVADITAVRMFDVKTGKPKGEVKIPGSSFLNDVAAAPAGGVYVTDSGVDASFKPAGTDAVYHIDQAGKLKPLIKSKDLGGPNGIAVAKDSVWVVTFGSGEIYEVTAKGEKKPSHKLPKGQLDGIVIRDDGEMLVASWEGQAVYAGKPGGEWRVVVKGLAAPADISWDPKRKALIVPQFMDNVVHVIKM